MKHYTFRFLIICTIFFSFSIQIKAQSITMINGGDEQACSGTFFDPGGTGNYSGESSTIVHTICSSTPGDLLKVEFTSFELFSNGCFWGTSIDRLFIYDGPSTSSPLIASYKESQGLGQVVYGSSGCLTFQFTREKKGGVGCSENNGAPGWIADISCVDEIPPSGTSCSDAIPFCSDESYNFPNVVSGTAPNGPNYGACNTVISGNGLANPVWYYMQIEDPGTLQIHLHQTTGPNETGSDLDLDFVMWGPYSSNSDACTQIMAGDPPIQRSFSPDGEEDIGIGVLGGSDFHCGSDGYGPTTPPPALAGEIYVVLITNPSAESGFISFEQTGGTGSADCAIVSPCSIDDFSINFSCDNDQFSMYGSIDFNEAPTSGDLIVEDCNGNQTVVASAPFTSPISYNITNVLGDGVPCSLTVFFSDNVNCSLTKSYTPPDCGTCTPPNLTINNIIGCSSNAIDLTDAIDVSSDPATTTFYNLQNDADNAINAISNSVTTSGSYWVRAENPGDATCYEVYEIQVTVITVTYTANNTQSTCGSDDGEIILTPNGGNAPYTYSIDGGATSQNSGTFSNIGAGTYNIVITDDNNCEATGSESITNSGTSDDASFTLTDFCSGETNSATITGTPDGTFSFLPIPSDGATINTVTGEITGGIGGTTYTVVYETNGSCPDTKTETVKVNPLPTYSISSTDPSCGNNDGEIEITPDSGVIIDDYSIDNGTTVQGGGSFPNLAAGNYVIYVKDNNGCEATETKSLSNLNGPIIDSIVATDPSCSNNDGEIEVFVSGGTGTITYAWFDDNNQNIGSSSSSNGLSGGNYSVEVTDNNGCVASDNATLIDPPAIDNASFTLTDFCEGAANSANISGTPNGTFSIIAPLGDDATVDATTGELSNGTEGKTYTIEYETSGACPNTSTEQVTVLSAPDVSLLASPNAGVPPLSVEFENTSLSSGSFIWDFGIGDTLQDDGINFTILYENAGNYVVVLTGENSNGCVDTAMTHILVNFPPMDYEFPNIFTPNGDGKNDIFKLISSQGIEELEIIILNRWGNLVYESDMVNFNWNGQVKNGGANCDDGTYFYKAKLKGFDDTEKIEHGFVQLSRNK